MIKLKKALLSDANELYDLQVSSFKALLEKYQDYDISPAAEKIEKTIRRLNEENSDYYFICLDNKNIGGIRIKHFETLCQLKQTYILPKYQNNGYAKQAIILAESLYKNATKWELDTIKQEEKLCYLYEKMGYKKTGEEQPVKDGMDIISFVKLK